ncbi:MAG: DNA polymerase III subunit delta, partial [Pseudomonadales bacterium]
MKIYPDRLEAHLEKSLMRLYWVSGDEPLLVQEAADAVRAAARRAGVEERVVFHVERGFDWQDVLNESDALSLFASRKLIETRLQNAKPGDKGSSALSELAKAQDENVILVTSPRVDAATQKTKWFKLVDQVGGIVQVWPLAPKDLPPWIQRRMASRGLK